MMPSSCRPIIVSFLSLCAVPSVAPSANASEATALAGANGAPFAWLTATPESQGLSSAKLEAFKDWLTARNTSALLITRNDRIVYEWYAKGTTARSKLGTASTAKALVGGVAAAVEISDGLVKLDDLAAKFIPQWRADPARSKITLRELGSHSSGLDDAEEDEPAAAGQAQPDALRRSIPHEKLTGWKGDFWKRLPVPHDPFTIARDVVPIVFQPGERYSYSNPGIAMLGYALTSALRGATQKDLRTFVRDRVYRKIGIGDEEWDIGYKETYLVDGLALVPAWGGGGFTARAQARIARLMLRGGDWDGQRIMTQEAARDVTLGANADGSSPVAVGWWNNIHGTVPGMPMDVYFAAGAGHRLVVVIPSLQAIVVRSGELLSPTEDYFVARDRYFFVPMMEALGIAQPVNRS
jgi:CubicO group peptidase (beta-lactamase class C family)